jgi:hypothetical protein
MKPSMPNEVAMLSEQLCDCLEDWSSVMPKPHHSGLLSEWKNEMKNFLEASYPDSEHLVQSVATGLLEAHDLWTLSDTKKFTESVDHNKTHALMQRPQTTQRTGDWYLEFQKCLTASEIFKVFGSPRERGILVCQKAGKLEMGARGSSLVVLKEKMGPLDWGICFEPVVKLILEESWGAMIYECGRFVHMTDKRFAASPDGLLVRVKSKPEMAGHLLEIKCPKTRKIGVKIPMEYYYQMQLQLEVTDVRACEYVEVKFEMPESDNDDIGKAKWYGRIAVIGSFNEDIGGWKPSRYIYGPINNLEWKPDLGLNEQTLEINTWICNDLHHETVLRDKAWFGNLWPKLNEFWSDVEKARRDEFTLPESSRKKKDTVCEIVDSEPEPEATPKPQVGEAEPEATPKPQVGEPEAEPQPSELAQCDALHLEQSKPENLSLE